MTRANLILIISILMVGFMAIGLSSLSGSSLLILVLILGLAACVVTLINTDAALVILIFSMLLSPEITIAQFGLNRGLAIRIEDILLFVIFITWLAKLAKNRELPLLRYTPINLPIILYIVVCIIASIRGSLLGTVNPVKSSFYIIKYIEYFLIFFMVVNNTRSLRQVKLFIAFLLIACSLVVFLAWLQIGAGVERVTAPFEGFGGEPNTFGGYLLFMWAIIFGIFWYVKDIKWKIFTGSLFFLIIPPFLFTLSRSSYTGVIPMFLTLAVLNEKRRGILTILLIIGAISFIFLVPPQVKNRIHETFIGRENRIAGKFVRLEESAGARVQTWNEVMVNTWPKRPVLGYGSGGPLIDGQYLTILAETGIAGLMIFVWMMLAIFRESIQNLYKLKDNTLLGGFTLGFIAGMTGLLAHALTSNTFIIVRIMEPFWFMTAIVIVLVKGDQPLSQIIES